MWKEKGIIVSCQAKEGAPLHGPHFMAEMAAAAVLGGAIGIRANGVADIALIKKYVQVPVIGLLKKQYSGFVPYITPTMDEALAVAYAGADIIAMDCTKNARPDGRSLKATIKVLREQTRCKIMADIATREDGEHACEAGVDYLATTLFGYTEETKHLEKPGFSLMEELVQSLPLPVIAEGGIESSEHVKRAFDSGVSWVVIGTAITSPDQITKRFVKAIHHEL